MKITRLFMIAAAVSMMLTACEKNGTDISSDDINLADDDVVAEATFDDIFSTADNATLTFDNLQKGLDLSKGGVVVMVSDSCPVVSVDLSNEAARVITVDYGEGCTGFYGQTRSGKILITFTGNRREPGSSRTVTFDNYYFNGIKVEGTSVTTNEGLNDNQNVVFSHSLTGGKLIFPDEKVVERQFYHEREWVTGFDTFNPWDDECLVTGSASGTNYRGVAYENSITTALLWKRICPFFVSGVIDIKRPGMDDISLNFGDGECDEYATLIKGDAQKEIILRKRHRILR